MEVSTPSSEPPTIVVDRQEAIRRRAEEIYVESGRISGRDLQNWAQAEREITAQIEARKRRSAVVVRVNGTQYVGEYRPESSDGYVPGEFGTGSSIAVRFQGDKMFLKRSNGKILETRIVDKIG